MKAIVRMNKRYQAFLLNPQPQSFYDLYKGVISPISAQEIARVTKSVVVLTEELHGDLTPVAYVSASSISPADGYILEKLND